MSVVKLFFKIAPPTVFVRFLRNLAQCSMCEFAQNCENRFSKFCF